MSEPKKRPPTIAELQKILEQDDGGQIEILPNGAITVDSELTRQREELAEAKKLLTYWQDYDDSELAHTTRVFLGLAKERRNAG